MKKFILLSFGFLGWAFYEMSGGADFVPASALVPDVEQAVLADAPAEAVEEAPAANDVTPAEDVVQTAFVDTDPPLTEPSNEVTRVALNLTTLQAAVDDSAAQEAAAVPVNPGFSVASADTPSIIPSLVVGADPAPVAQEETAVTLADDIRTVSGNRVNVRGGPGTDFGIVSKLVRGDAVEILQDNGNGWVLMRPVNGDVEGWMADFLLSSS